MSSIDDILLSAGIYDEIYQKWKANPLSVEASWRLLFENLDKESEIPLQPKKSLSSPELYPPQGFDEEALKRRKAYSLKIAPLIDGWRTWGHLAASFNPLKSPPSELASPLALDRYGFEEGDLKELYPTLGLLEVPESSLERILARLKVLYGGKIGFEFKGFTTPETEAWFEKEVEGGQLLAPPNLHKKQRILQELYRSELFERFVHTKFAGQKRFSLEGAETLIPMLRELVESAAEAHIEELVIGMAHRGRLNVLSSILNKSFKQIFSEFEESYLPEGFLGTGDVKYHKGFETEVLSLHERKIKVHLTPNPSHLESIDPVIQGQVKGKQTKVKGGAPEERVMAVLIHGDASLAGQGVVYETLQMQGLEGYKTGGTLHLVINNQIGFTTDPEEGRSTLYCTDCAKAFGCPILHVNAEDPEGCVAAVHLALKYRQHFKRDIFVELNGYRKYGHNESDEPDFTQPVLYSLIKGRRSIPELYCEELIRSGSLERAVAELIEKEFKRALNEAKESFQVVAKEGDFIPWVEEVQSPPSLETGVRREVLLEIAEKLSPLPENFALHPKVELLFKDRLARVKGEGGKALDWGTAEALTFATLLWEGRPVRLAGQDVKRGTFSHRHAVVFDQKNGSQYIPLNHLKESQARFSIYNSPLSEFAALGFEYGYSLSVPEGLTVWEAQYGDFVNGAQVIIDQYLATSEQKWGKKSRLTLLLPHGYEGQGPEHSSARIERFLSLAGHDNLRIAYPSLPHQFFHLLRRETLTQDPRPLIIFTPKANLRLPACSSPLEMFESGEFQEVLDDPNPPPNPLKLVFCTGKIYFELKAYGAKIKDESVAIVRVEELYPLYTDPLSHILEKYSKVKEILWVQEEPENMGAWYYMEPHLEALAGRKVRYVGRQISATTATGIYYFHKKELHSIMEQVFSKDSPTTYEIAGQIRA